MKKMEAPLWNTSKKLENTFMIMLMLFGSFGLFSLAEAPQAAGEEQSLVFSTLLDYASRIGLVAVGFTLTRYVFMLFQPKIYMEDTIQYCVGGDQDMFRLRVRNKTGWGVVEAKIFFELLYDPSESPRNRSIAEDYPIIVSIDTINLSYIGSPKNQHHNTQIQFSSSKLKGTLKNFNDKPGWKLQASIVSVHQLTNHRNAQRLILERAPICTGCSVNNYCQGF